MWRIFEPKKEGVGGSWIKLHNEELQYLSFTPVLVGYSNQ
jgi:hypothetical protein